jgi:uncharacterized membrane protein YbhN (UPF0104 family)
VAVEVGEQAPAQAGPGRSRRWRWVKPTLLVVMIGFAVAAVLRNRHELGHALRLLHPLAVAGSIPVAFAATGVALFVWRTLLADLGAPLPVPAAARVFYSSQLGKYVPGSVWSVLAQVELAREYHVPRRCSLAVGILTLPVAICVGLPISALCLPFAAPDAARRYWWAVLFVPLLIGVLHPAVLGRLLNVAMRVLRREPLPQAPSWGGLLRAAGWQALVWILLGVHAWLLLVGIGAPVGRSLPLAVGGYALAYSLGLLAVPVPAGAGVRDVALTVTFASVVAGPAALVVALVSRTILTLVDVSMAGLQHLPRRRPQV